MGREKVELGMEGEIKAVDYLDRRGYEILERNYRTRLGEIDIIARKNGTLCLVEVKTRTGLRHGVPAAAVDGRKLEHIRRCGILYMKRTDLSFEAVRIDVIEVLKTRGSFYIRHLKSVG